VLGRQETSEQWCPETKHLSLVAATPQASLQFGHPDPAGLKVGREGVFAEATATVGCGSQLVVGTP
jgi:hypothetical protein